MESKVLFWCIYLWFHNKCSGITDRLTDNRNFVCRKCSVKIIPGAIASFKEVNFGNHSFHVESIFKNLGDTIGQCDGCSDTVSTLIVSSWKALRELIPILTSLGIRTKLRGNVFNMCVRKKLSYGSKTWPVMVDVQQ